MRRKTLLLLSLVFILVLTVGVAVSAQDIVSIKEIQSNTVDGDASAYKGEKVTSEGVVTAIGDNGFYIQDGRGPWTGIWVYSGASVAPGDKVRVTGVIDEYYELTEFNDPENVEVIGQEDVPEPLLLDTSEVSQEKYEGVLVRVEDLEVTDPSAGHDEWLVDDGSGEVKIAADNTGDASQPTSAGEKIDYIVGPVTFDYGEYKIQPKDIAGLQITFPEKGNLGQAVEYPEDLPKIEKSTGHLLADKVSVSGSDKGVRLSFTTSREVSNIKIEYGINYNQTKAAKPTFSEEKVVELDQGQTDHQINIDLSKLNIDDKSLINFRIHADKIPYGDKFKVEKTNNGFKVIPYIAEGPFVDMVTKNSAVISWKTSVPTTGQVKVNGNIFEDKEKSTYHEIKVKGLKAETDYGYQVINQTENYNWKTSAQFTTESADNSFKFAFMGDGRSESAEEGLEVYGDSFNYDTVTDLFLDAQVRNSEFIIFGGDLIDGYTNTASDYRLQLQSWKNASEIVGFETPIYEVMGNHEALYTAFDDGSTYGVQFDKKGDKSAEAIFADEFVNPVNGPTPEHDTAPSYDENAYYFDYDNTRFIVINTNYWWSSHAEKYGGNLEGYILSNQMDWIKEKVAEAESKDEIDHIIPILHEPPFPNGGHTSDAMWYNGQKDYVLEMRDEFWNIIADSSKTNVVLASDEHNYQRVLITEETPVYANMNSADYEKPLWQIVSGGAGAPKYDREYAPWGSYVKEFAAKENYVQFEINDQQMIIKAIANNGNIIDKKVLSSIEKADNNTYKFAQFNIQNLTTEQVQEKGDPQAEAAAEVIQRVNPDVLFLNEITNNLQQGKMTDKNNVRAFIENYLQKPQKEGLPAVDYEYIYFGKSNTGIHSGFDLNNDGKIADEVGESGYGNDAFGFGEYPGQYAMALLSKYPIVEEEIRTFRKFLWKDMPDNKMPEEFYNMAEQQVFRLSSKSHWDVPIEIGGETVHVLAAHPTPPVFDGEYNRNGRRNHDEVRLFADYIKNKEYIYSDSGEKGGLAEDAKFVVMGDMNANPGEKENFNAAGQLLNNERINSEILPMSQGAINIGPAARHYTQEDMKLDYVLPSNNLNKLGSAVVRPGTGPNAMEFIKTVKKASDHNMVWIELQISQ